MITESDIKEKERYIENCIWWIREYFKGGCEKKNFDKAVLALEEFAKEKQKTGFKIRDLTNKNDITNDNRN